MEMITITHRNVRKQPNRSTFICKLIWTDSKYPKHQFMAYIHGDTKADVEYKVEQEVQKILNPIT